MLENELRASLEPTYKSLSFYFLLFVIVFLFFPWGFITPLLVGGGTFFEYRGLAYVLILLLLIFFLLEYKQFKSKRTSFYLPILMISAGTLLSLIKHTNVSATSEFAVYLCSIVGLGFLSTFFSYDEKKKEKIILFLLVLIDLLAIYGIYQYFIIYPSLQQQANTIKNYFDFRLTSVLTSPAAYASVVIMTWPLTLIGLIKEKSSTRRLFYAVSLVLLLFSLIFTFSKSGFAALFVQLILMTYFLAKYYPQVLRKKFFPFLGLFLLIFTAIFGYGYYLSDGKLLSLSNFKTSFEGRLSIWKTALKMFVENPFTGIGAGCFKDIYFKYQADGFFSTNAHSSYIQAFSETGILGGVGFLLFAIYLILRCCILNKDLSVSKFIGFSSVGFLFINLFDSLFYYHLAGFLLSILIGLAYSEINKPLVIHRDFPRNAFIAFFITFLGLSVLVNLAFYFNQYGQKRVINDFNEGIRFLRLSTYLNPIESEYHRSLAQAYSGGIFSNKAYRYLRITEIKRAIFLQPYNPRYYFELGYFYETESQPELAIYFYKKAAALAPKQPFYLFQIGRLYSESLKTEEAKKFYKKCLSLEFYYQKKYVFQSYRTGGTVNEFDPYLNMARAAIALGNESFARQDYKEAIAYYQKAIILFPGYPDAYASLASAYLRMQNYKAAIENVQKAIELDSNNANYYYLAAICYYYLRDYSNAFLYISEALKLNPHNEEFINLYNKIRKEYR